MESIGDTYARIYTCVCLHLCVFTDSYEYTHTSAHVVMLVYNKFA